MFLIMGLGNPGAAYRGSRHNVGFEVCDLIAAQVGVTFRRSLRFKSCLAEARYQGELLLVAKPQTFMNNSGAALTPLLRRRGLDLARLLVIYDDLDLELGRLRLRGTGSAGGHRGMASIMAAAGTRELRRIRVGIGRPPAGVDPVTYVLQRPTAAEREVLERTMLRAAEAALALTKVSLAEAMNRYNT